MVPEKDPESSQQLYAQTNGVKSSQMSVQPAKSMETPEKNSILVFFLPDLYQRLGFYSRLNCMSADVHPPGFHFLNCKPANMPVEWVWSLVSSSICQSNGWKKKTWRSCRWVKYMICKGTVSEASSFYIMIARISLLNDSSISRPAYVCAVIWYSSRRKSKHERPLSSRPHDSELREIS